MNDFDVGLGVCKVCAPKPKSRSLKSVLNILYLWHSFSCNFVFSVNSYRCECEEGWSGETCSINIDDCAINPCLNGGTCIDLLNAYVCQCSEYFNGDTCAENNNPCRDSPCFNDGICEPNEEQFICRCLSGYEGVTCENIVTNSLPLPPSQPTLVTIDRSTITTCDTECFNGGTCNVDGTSCICPTGTNGTNCQSIIGCPIPLTQVYIPVGETIQFSCTGLIIQ